MRSHYAKLFVIVLGLIFIMSAIAISLTFEILNVVPIGMGIIGIFLVLLPFTSVVKKQ